MGYFEVSLLGEEGPLPETLSLHDKIPNIAPFPNIPGFRTNRVITEATGKRRHRGWGEASMEAGQSMWDRVQIPHSRLNHKPGNPGWLVERIILL